MTNNEALAYQHAQPKKPFGHTRIVAQRKGDGWTFEGSVAGGNWEIIRWFTCYPAMLNWIRAWHRRNS